MTTRHKSKELGSRIQAAIEASGLTRARVAERIGMDQSSLARVCYGERSIDEAQLEALARTLHLHVSTLSGSQQPQVSDSSRPSLDMSAPGGTVASGRQGQGRAGFLERHRDELSKIEVEFISEVEITAGGRVIEPADDSAWWALLDWYREEQRIARRNGR